MPPPNTPVQAAAAIPIPVTPQSGARYRSSLADGHLDSSPFQDPHPYLPQLPSAYLEPPSLRSPVRKVDENGLPTQEPENLELHHHIDLTMLIYLGTPDENLTCDICRVPFVDAVMTPCLHIYCRKCLTDALYFNGSICPTDRTRLDENSIRKAPAIIRKQVDALRAECPACCKLIPRSTIQHHLATTCLEARMACPGRFTDEHCNHQILRKNLTDRCLHYTVACDDCGLSVFMIDMNSHKLQKCEERKVNCSDCGKEYPKVTTEEHAEKCPESTIPCKWASLGCDFISKRKDIGHHHETCGHRFTGSVIDNLINQVTTLRISTEEKITLKDTRIRDLEIKTRALDAQVRDLFRPVDESPELLRNQLMPQFMPASIFPELDEGSDLVSPQQFARSFDDVLTRIDRLEQTLAETEGRNSVLTLNEMILMRNELLELRSAQQVTAQRVTWLVNIRLQENQQHRAAIRLSNAGPTGGDDDSGGESPGRRVSRGPRRSNDSIHEPPRL